MSKVDIRKCLAKARAKLKKLHDQCEICSKTTGDLRTFLVKNEDFQGGCGDSFCWANCDSDSCKTREFAIRACKACGEKL